MSIFYVSFIVTIERWRRQWERAEGRFWPISFERRWWWDHRSRSRRRRRRPLVRCDGHIASITKPCIILHIVDDDEREKPLSSNELGADLMWWVLQNSGAGWHRPFKSQWWWIISHERSTQLHFSPAAGKAWTYAKGFSPVTADLENAITLSFKFPKNYYSTNNEENRCDGLRRSIQNMRKTT